LATEALIPQREWTAANGPKMVVDGQIRGLASRVHVHPAIVAGRVRFEKKDYSLFPHLVGQRLIRKHFPAYQTGLVVG
jgi:HTH-type transcriptional regulator / antitoxin HigA